MEAKCKNIKRIAYEDFDVQWVRSLAREGRLWYSVQEPSAEDVIESQLLQVMEYVEVIHGCASVEYIPYIGCVWECIVRDPELNDQLFIRKGRNHGLVNRYRIMAIVTVLLEFGVYDKGVFTLISLYYRLEDTCVRNSVYTSYLNYALSAKQVSRLRGVVKDFLKK